MSENESLLSEVKLLNEKIDRLSIQLRTVGQDIPREIDSYHFLQSELMPKSRIRPAGGWAAPYETIARLTEIILEDRGGLNIVELGGGISTIWLGYALQKAGRGKITSVEHDEKFMSITRAQIDKHELNEWIELVHAPIESQLVNKTTQNWYKLEASQFLDSKIDILIVDGPPGRTDRFARWPAYPYFSAQLADESLVMLDDVDRPDEQTIGKRWTDEDNSWGSLSLVERLGRSSLYKFTRN